MKRDTKLAVGKDVRLGGLWLLFVMIGLTCCQKQGDVCSVSLAGCKCESNWSYQDSGGLTGCSNPDADPLGTWCKIVEGSCEEGRSNWGTVLAENNAPFDYCPACGGKGDLDLQNGPCFQSKKGCQCATVWSYGEESMLIGCQNPDSDVRGLWCQVSEDCDVYNELEFIRGSSGLETQFKFDYCVDSCSQAIGVDTNSGCETTQSGCLCLSEWSYRGAQQQGCAVVEDGPGGPFCAIIPNSCQSGEPAGKITDPITGIVIQQMDLCSPQCVDSSNTLSTVSVVEPTDEQFATAGVCLSTKNGCRCKKSWFHDADLDSVPALYYGCALTPDRGYSWCQIQDSSSCSTSPINPEWDECSSECLQQLQGECKVSENGCQCKERWQFEGVQVKGCARPDSYPLKTWCAVDTSTCPTTTNIGGISVDYCPNNCS